MKSKITFVILLVFTSVIFQAKELEGEKKANSSKIDALMNRAENCFPPTAYIRMDLNNVNFGFENGGLMWLNGDNQQYEVPKNSGLHSLFAGGLWMGGRIDVTNQLRLAAIKFGNSGTDFWPGPLTIGDNDEGISNGLAISSVCQEYDRHYKVKRIDCQLHQQWFDLLELGDPTLLNQPPFENGYTMPDYFNEWPGNNEMPGFNKTLAPFYDRNKNKEYEPLKGDYPGYDITGEAKDCRNRGPQDPIPLFGDETVWWVFNDNGGIHTESSDGLPIQMEIQAQAFVYSTTDEINSMSFYNYVMINRGTLTLKDTYFGQYADPDIGCAEDDFVGCDVSRGLGYAYNGDELDNGCGSGQASYESNTPAIGIDFFEGPYLDPDGVNNVISKDASLWADENAIPYAGLGIGFKDSTDILIVDGEIIADNSDQFIDNERFGMRKFIYYNNGTCDECDPDKAVEFYNYLTGVWAGGAPLTYGGPGFGGEQVCDYMYPNDTDPEDYGTAGITMEPWSEESVTNEPADRRFLQSAGPFTLEPGEFNNITVGVVWTQAPGGIDDLREALFIADDKAQALFDNCFSILNGPKAPGLSVQELDQELILYLDPTVDSENYEEEDAAIPNPDNKYVFEGYKVYQLVSNAVSSSDLENRDKARLVAQVDLENEVNEIFAYETIEGGLISPVLKVSGENEGLQHSFQVVTDLFSGSPIINHQKYYFMAIAYGYNNYETYDIGENTGQSTPYIESRLSYTNGTISPIVAVPHRIGIENNGTIVTAEYGELLPVRKIEGRGNGSNFIELTQESIDEIMEGPPWMAAELDYKLNRAPIGIKIIDPLRVRKGDFKIKFFGEEPEFESVINPSETNWQLEDEFGNVVAVSEQSIDVKNEYLLLDYGIAITIENPKMIEFDNGRLRPTFNGATITFKDEEIPWLSGFKDTDDLNEQNWIRSGSAVVDCPPNDQFDPINDCYYNDRVDGLADPDEEYESILGGIITPWILTGFNWSGPTDDDNYASENITRFNELNNVNIVFTDDKSLWSRVPVIEIQHFPENAQNGGFKTYPRVALSVDKNGRNILHLDHNLDEITYNGDQVLSEEFIDEYMQGSNNATSISYQILEHYKEIRWPEDDPTTHERSDLYGESFGFGWFPGYAIDVETGERLNMMFGENSGLGFDNGTDMIWNPTSRDWNRLIPDAEDNPVNAFLGGMHYIYVFRNEARTGGKNDRVITYDGSNRLYKTIYGGNSSRRRTYSSVSWCMLPKLDEDYSFKSIEEGLIPTETTIKLRVNKPFERYAPSFLLDQLPNEFLTEDGFFNYDDFDLYDPEFNVVQNAQNDWFPYYSFSTDGAFTMLNDIATAQSLLDEINVVPNPYYGFSDYELNRLDNRVKIINLPNRCKIRIFNTAGTLVRVINHDVSSEILDATVEEWDLKNEENIPISGGTYILHIESPDLGNKVVKWFGVTRKLDLQNY